MLAGAYTLSRNGHVRGDFLYRAWSPRTQAKWDLVLYILFFFPGMLAFVYAGYGFAKLSWLMNEHSSASPNGPPVYHFKSLIPIVGVLMVMQGIVEVMRCVMCIRTGEWPQRLHDVEELDKIMLEKAEHGEYAVVKELEEIGAAQGVRSDVRHRQSRTGRADARPVRRLHHVRLPDRVHADGARRVLRLFRDGRPGLQPAGPAHLFGDDERRADLDPAVRLHGLHHRAREHPRPAVPIAAARGRPDARRRSRSRRLPPARSSRPRPASSAPW